MGDLLFLGLDEEKTKKVYDFIVRSVSDGIDAGAKKVAAKYETAAKVHFGATVLTAAAAVAVVIILLAKD